MVRGPGSLASGGGCRRRRAVPLHVAEELHEERRGRALELEGRQFMLQGLVVLERKASASGSRKKSNGFNTAISATRSTSTRNSRSAPEDQPGQVIGLRVLLPVEEMLFRQDPQRVTQDRRAAMRRGPQTHHVRQSATGRS